MGVYSILLLPVQNKLNSTSSAHVRRVRRRQTLFASVISMFMLWIRVYDDEWWHRTIAYLIGSGVDGEREVGGLE